MITDLDLVKRQCRVDFDDDDKLLIALTESAEQEVCRITGRSVDELLAMGSDGFPGPIHMAILVRVAQLYHQPEGSDKPNAVYQSLLRPYQKIC
ncbi:MAG: head-tail connector protein [Muribaculaceae bacterium]|nr:head-tail connector protein [Muribaculaceae bacterium]